MSRNNVLTTVAIQFIKARDTTATKRSSPHRFIALLMVLAQLFVVAALGAGVMVPNVAAASASSSAKRSALPERWREMAHAWAKTDDEATTKKWGLEVAIIKRGMDVVGVAPLEHFAIARA